MYREKKATQEEKLQQIEKEKKITEQIKTLLSGLTIAEAEQILYPLIQSLKQTVIVGSGVYLDESGNVRTR